MSYSLFIKRFTVLAAIVLLVSACGGGGISSGDEAAEPESPAEPIDIVSTVASGTRGIEITFPNENQ